MSQPVIAGIGRRIAHYRKLNGWSARQLAENTDGAITRDTIANIENGRRADLTVRQLLGIALALRVPPTVLLTDLQHPFEPSNIVFPGPAPAPLEQAAPHIAVAAWLNTQTANDTTPAARWVTRVTALLTDYLAALDTAAAQAALDRLAAPVAHDDRGALTARRRGIRTDLATLGVHLRDDE